MPNDAERRTTIIVPSERPKAHRPPRLVVIAGEDLGRQIELGGQVVEIGRSEQVTLRVDSDLVSRRHARIECFAHRYVVTDLGSTNGTYVNDARIGQHELRDGDLIRIGKTVVKYSESDVEAEYHFRIFNMARVDGLTGLFNKQHFDEAIRKEVAQSHATGRPLSLVLFDIDHFKKINDTLGHLAGDAVLSGLAELVRGVLPETSACFRVGGEEFAIVCPGASLAVGLDVAELVRCAVERNDFVFETRRIPVTSSFGVAELAPEEKPEQLYKRSDERLYEAKRSGRNRVG